LANQPSNLLRKALNGKQALPGQGVKNAWKIQTLSLKGNWKGGIPKRANKFGKKKSGNWTKKLI